MTILFKDKEFYYSYREDRNYNTIKDSFLKNTLKALDYIYMHDLLVLNFKNDTLETSQKINILDLLMRQSQESVFIKQGEKNQYNPNNNTITFYDTHGIRFRKNHKKRFTTKNIGYNSPVTLLAHEIIHCFHELYDTTNYTIRKRDKTTKGKKITPLGRDLSFSNKEEKLTTLLTNQIARKLGEDVRRNYGRNYYPVKDVLLTDENRIS